MNTKNNKRQTGAAFACLILLPLLSCDEPFPEYSQREDVFTGEVSVDGTIVFEDLPFVQDGGAKIYGPIDFLPSVEVQIFERVQPIQFGGEMFTLTFRVLPG
jgi:hypothetical protein